MDSANPYLNFPGNCMEAFDFYRSVFRGVFAHVSRFSDVPSEAASDESQEASADGLCTSPCPSATRS